MAEREQGKDQPPGSSEPRSRESKDAVAQRFAENLARARKESGLTQEALAQSAEIHRTQIGELLRGNQLPRLDTLLRLAGALNVPPADLLDGLSFQPSAQGQFKVEKTRPREH